MKILLLNPPYDGGDNFIREGRCTHQEGIWAALWPPVSLVYIGTLLKKKGNKVKLFDCYAEKISIKKLKIIIQSYNLDAIIWSTGTPFIENDLNLAAMFKDIIPSAATAVFGTYVTVLDEECLKKYPALDVIIRNEPEYTICEWVDALKKKKCNSIKRQGPQPNGLPPDLPKETCSKSKFLR